MKDIKTRVEEMLNKYEKTRDNDKLLTAYIWYQEMAEKAQTFENVVDFLSYYAYGGLTCADTITRARRKLQETNAFLRGKSYGARQDKELVIRENVDELFK